MSEAEKVQAIVAAVLEALSKGNISNIGNSVESVTLTPTLFPVSAPPAVQVGEVYSRPDRKVWGEVAAVDSDPDGDSGEARITMRVVGYFKDQHQTTISLDTLKKKWVRVKSLEDYDAQRRRTDDAPEVN